MDKKLPLSQGGMIWAGNRNAGLFHSPSAARFDVFLKGAAAHIIRLVFFKNPAGAPRGVNPEESGGPFGTGAKPTPAQHV